MRKLYTLGHSQCRLQSRAQVGASSPFTTCTRFVFLLLLLLGGVMQGVVGQITTTLNPANEATGILPNAELSITFNGNISFNPGASGVIRIRLNNTTTNFQSFGIFEGEDISGLLSLQGNKLVIQHNSFNANQSYYVIIPAGIINVEGIGLFAGISDPATWTFTTGTAPQLAAISPLNGATGVTLSPTLSMTFDEAVVKGSGNLYLFRSSDNQEIKSISVNSLNAVTIDGTLVSIPLTGLVAGTSYYVKVDKGFVKSLASGVDFGGIPVVEGSSSWTFTTGSAPQLSAISPTHNGTGVLLGANLTATFDVPVRFNSGSEPKTISIKDMSTGQNFVTFSVSGGQSSSSLLTIAGNVLSIDPSSTLNLEYGTNYQVYIQSGALESEIGIPFGGIPLGNWSFTTEDAPAPVGTMATPTGTNISILTDVVITYSVAIRNLDDSAITDANVKDLIKIYRGSVALENLMPEAGYTATIAADKKSITIRLVPGGYYFPNADVNVVINQVENNQNIEQNLAQTFTFKTGQYNIWRGTADSNWNNSANWQSSYVQGGSIIIESGSHDAELDIDLTAPNLIIGNGGKLTVNENKTLTVTNDFRMFSVNGDVASASLVVNGTLSTVPSKTFIYQGITNINYDYYISSPVTGALKSVVAPSGSVFQYNPTTDAYDPLANGDILLPGKGYGGYAPAGSSFSFSGSVNQASEYSLTCARTSKNAGWNLAGNPYPCAINLASTYLGTDRFVGFKPHVYIRDNATFQLYAWNFSAETGTADGPEIPAMHSFWVQVATDQSTGTLVMNSSDRMHNTKNYHKSASATPVQKPTIKLFTQNGAVKDLSVITFISGNDDAYDDYDSEKRFAQHNLVADLYTIKDGKRLVINSFSEYSGSKEVPIGVYARKAGTYTLGIASLVGFDQEVELKLVDYGTSPATTHDLSSGDYSFTVAGNTYIDHRFLLQVSNKVATGVEQPEANREVTIYAFQSDVVIENKGEAVGQYTIYDLSGRVLTSGVVGAFSKVSVPMPVKGVVLGAVKTSKGMVNQKLLIQ